MLAGLVGLCLWKHRRDFQFAGAAQSRRHQIGSSSPVVVVVAAAVEYYLSRFQKVLLPLLCSYSSPDQIFRQSSAAAEVGLLPFDQTNWFPLLAVAVGQRSACCRTSLHSAPGAGNSQPMRQTGSRCFVVERSPCQTERLTVLAGMSLLRRQRVLQQRELVSLCYLHYQWGVCKSEQINGMRQEFCTGRNKEMAGQVLTKGWRLRC